MKSKILNEFFDLNDYITLKCITSLTEDEELKISAKITSNEIKNINEIINNKTFIKKMKDSKLYKDIKGSKNKVRKILEDTVEKIKSLEVDHKSSSLSDETRDKITFWSISITSAITIAFEYSSPIILTLLVMLITIEITLFIINFVNISIFGDTLIRYSILGDKVDRFLFKTQSFKCIEHLTKINKKDIKDINNNINTGKLSLVENFEENNILNELMYLPSRIINTLLEFIINVIRYPVYLFYSIRTSIDDYLQVQIQFLENNIKNNKLDKDVKEKQQKWLDNFKNLSSKVAVDFNKASVEADTKIKKISKDKNKFSDISNEIPSNLFIDF